jgi:hypothetical protein
MKQATDISSLCHVPHRVSLTELDLTISACNANKISEANL